MKDLSGQTFGRLTALAYAGNYKWKCECSCGTIKSIRTADLLSGSTSSCGCLRSELTSKTKREDLTGLRFGRLVVIKPSGKKWECLCDCGNTITTRATNLKSGDTKSCGCRKSEATIKRNTTHGLSKDTRLYSIWKGMRQRCNDPNSSSYHRYGGRGICICQEWDDFSVFYNWAIQTGFNENPTGYTIDRIDNNRGYEPGNCRWATMKEQANNTSRNRKLEFNGENHTISEWAGITGVPQGLLWNRLYACGWSVEKALMSKVGD